MVGPSPENRHDEDDARNRAQRDYVRHTALGFEFAATVGGLAWLGWLLDGRLGLQTSFPAFLLVGTFLGLGLGMYRLILKTGQVGKRKDEDSE